MVETSKGRSTFAVRAFLQQLRRPSSSRHAPALLLLSLMACLLAAGALRDSPTLDESSHLVAGLGVWWGGDARLSTPHPPLANAWQAIPAALATPHLDLEELRGWDRDWSWEDVTRAYLKADYAAARKGVIAGRFFTLGLTLLLGLYLYRQILPYGLTLARATLVIYALHPLFLAHGRLVTTDLPITAATVLVVGETLRYLRTRNWLPLLGLGLSLGIAFSTKYSGLLLLPPLLLSLAVAMLAGCERFAPRNPLASRAGLACRDLLVMGVLACLVVNATYLFQRTGWSVGEILEHPEPKTPYAAKGKVFEMHSPLPEMPAWLPIPLPYPYVFGIFSVKAQNERGHGGWFWGERRKEGSRLYFPVLTVIKNPLSVLLLLPLALVLALCRWRWRDSLRRIAPWTMPVLVPLTFFAFSIPSKIQLGIRHLLPVMPFLIVAAAWVAAQLWDGRTWLQQKWSRVLCLGLLALLVAETAFNHPRYLGHFSWLIGGNTAGHRISMMGEDWGQDLGDLADLVRQEEGMQPLYYRPYGFASARELAFQGIPFRRFSCKTHVQGPAWIAVHAAVALRLPRRCGPIRKGRPPDRILNHHIWLYQIK